MTDLQFHPLANIFPLMEGAPFDEFVADVREHGVREPIVLFEGMILDGRNRYRAAKIAAPDESVPCREFDDLDAVAFVVSANLKRRHLNESQRALAAANLANVKRGGDRKSEAFDQTANSRVTHSSAANIMNISQRSVETAATMRETAAPELLAEVGRGKVSVSAAADIAKLPIDEQRAVIAAADPKAFRAVAKEVRAREQADKRERRADKEIALGAKQRALPDKRFGVILADPEWRFEVYSRDSGMDRSADNHYPTSSVEEIMARDVASISADDCVLFLWATAPMLQEAFQVMKAWGFTYKSQLIWFKQRPGDARGTGYWFLNEHEILLVGTRGDIPAPALGTQVRSVFLAPVGEHSEKPDDQYEIIERYFPTLPKIELNARRARDGWDAWGLEAPEDSGS